MSCKKGLNWGEQETKIFLELCIKKCIVRIIDGKKHKHIEIYRMLEPEMIAKGFHKTAEQMKLKMKNLKLAYFKCKRENKVSGASPSSCPFYEQMDILYGSRPSAEASNSGGIDTLEINEENFNLEKNDTPNGNNDATTTVNLEKNVTVNNDATTGDEEYFSEEENNSPQPKKKQTMKKCGRKSYESLLQNYMEKCLENQTTLLKNITESQKEMLQQEMAEQRIWEQQEMEKERAFQKEQTEMLIKAFMQSATPRMPFHPVQNQFMNLNRMNLLPMNVREAQSSGMSTSGITYFQDDYTRDKM